MDNRNMINRVLSQRTLHQITIKDKSDVVDETYDFYIQGPKNISVIQKMKPLYNYLKKSYRSEYFCKDTMLSKSLLRLHSVNTTTALSEMPIGDSIADFILLNSRDVVYGIKTELDKLDKLDNQINDYYKVFNYVVVITNDKHLGRVMARYRGTIVGTSVLTSGNTLSEVQKSKKNNSLLNSGTMYDFLRREERRRVIAQNHMDVSAYSDSTEYDVLFDVFKGIPMTELHNNMIFEPKRRGNMREYKGEFLAASAGIKFLLYFVKMAKKDKNKLYHFLEDTNNPPHFT